MADNVKLYDTTLRDGAQTEGISFSVTDKVRIAQKLDELGVHYIEAGWPGANPKDIEVFKKLKKLRLKNSKITAFGSTKRPKIKAKDDVNLRSLIKAETKAITIFGKSWDLHVKDILRTSLEENLNMITESVAYLKSKNKEVIYDAEHFFDGFKSNPPRGLGVGSYPVDLTEMVDVCILARESGIVSFGEDIVVGD